MLQKELDLEYNKAISNIILKFNNYKCHER
jgi:hypothetical protein